MHLDDEIEESIAILGDHTTEPELIEILKMLLQRIRALEEALLTTSRKSK